MSVFASPGEEPAQAVHPGPHARPMHMILLGPGQVGSALLDQLATSVLLLARRSGMDIRLAGVANSRSMRLFDTGSDHAPHWPDWSSGAEPADLDVLLAHGAGLGRRPGSRSGPDSPGAGGLMVVDCTASDAVADHYAGWLKQGVHVVTANKHAGSGCIHRYRRIVEAAAEQDVSFRCEATVGAGLPVIQTLREMLDGGDELLAVQGCLSGTLSWLFNEYDAQYEAGISFSRLLLKAQGLGYTEPDPRDDLSGLDVARKLLILAREAGMSVSMDAISVESLVPDKLVDSSRDGFLRDCHWMDGVMAERMGQARVAGGRLVYVGRLERDGCARVGLEVLPPSSPCAQLQGSDNLIQLHTRHYHETPMVLRGPGAGPAVTAAGVLRDIITVARQHRVYP